ncbi:MAG: SAM-dependent methyltransferase [Alphaproteobacteria bacterium HGW-Alphaproteobacteria-3]|nr:MAG: SAM-dependent methyltransferase [Alphaproteobacteria bacterium HGW-Alphaproteobacteria-3]
MMTRKSNAVAQAEAYYDSPDADSFYFTIWGGEDIHIGMYKDDNEPIVPASHRNDETLASMLEGVDKNTVVLDIGAGYGGAARHLARTRGCKVVCVNISETQNRLNRELNKKAGLDDRIDVLHGDFEVIPADDDSIDVVWSQDAILHSGNRPRVLDEVKRVLKPGGQFIFTDPMQSDDCPEGVLQPILDRIHLETLGSFGFYDRELRARGFDKLDVREMTHQLRRHYWRVGEELKANYDRLTKGSSTAYLDNMIKGLGHWVDGADKGYLAWGVMHYRLAK